MCLSFAVNIYLVFKPLIVWGKLFTSRTEDVSFTFFSELYLDKHMLREIPSCPLFVFLDQ